VWDWRRHVSPHTQVLTLPESLVLESGRRLDHVQVAYRTWGTLSPTRDNAVVVCHALTGSADVDDWWPGLLGPGHAIDPTRDFVMCANVLGGCYGSTGPTSIDPATGRPWGPDFPEITVRDMVAAQIAWARALGVRGIATVIGGSLGGMLALEWALMAPDLVRSLIPIATGAASSAWSIGFSEAQRHAIAADADWEGGRYDPDRPPVRGLAAARMLAMCTYRSPRNFERRFARSERSDGVFQVASYLRHQGDKLVGRFDALSYVRISQALDSHDVARGRDEPARVLAGVLVPALIVSISSDVLFPEDEQRLLAMRLPAARRAHLESADGHDAFLIEIGQIDRMVATFRGVSCV